MRVHWINYIKLKSMQSKYYETPLYSFHTSVCWRNTKTTSSFGTMMMMMMTMMMLAFFSLAIIFGRTFDHSFPAHAVFCFVFRWRIARVHEFHSLGQDQSTVAQQAQTTVAECSPDKLLVSSFQDGFPHYAWTAA